LGLPRLVGFPGSSLAPPIEDDIAFLIFTPYYAALYSMGHTALPWKAPIDCSHPIKHKCLEKTDPTFVILVYIE